MLVAAAVCPHPPLIVPELAGAAAPELDGLRAACAEAVAALRAAAPDLLLVVGGDDTTREYGPRSAGSLAPWGVDVRTGEGDPVLPLSLTIGRWLLGGDPDGFLAVAADASPARCLELGKRLASGSRVALLVMADGSAKLTGKSPGYLDPAAEPYQRRLVKALAEADLAAIAELDPGEAAELWAGGRAPLQVLAGAAAGVELRPELVLECAPYGVGYAVAVWS
ncbi:class III extradiol dioxygenase subunit B-like domain-containing protein [Nonomuraea sp. NPDC050540]|uniref:class III extradiol dioxygenase subunit B-like domain-containing protein n=1 Tax=Nonomuraea sp. NPDC050540 TaxID=3364367 RepID=UPI00378A528B